MSMTFTKLFTSITESTVWLTPASTRIVWITMIAMADRHGRVYASVPGLAHRARVTVDECKEALRTFEEPDEDSRTKEFEGRRILAFEGGWELLNHAKYRAIQNDEAIRESKRAYMQRQREKWNSSSTVENLPLDLDLPKEEKAPKKRGSWRIVPEDWVPKAAHRDKVKHWPQSRYDSELQKFRDWEFKEPKTDADRAFSRWLRKAEEGGFSSAPRQPEKSEWQRKQDEGEYAR